MDAGFIKQDAKNVRDVLNMKATDLERELDGQYLIYGRLQFEYYDKENDRPTSNISSRNAAVSALRGLRDKIRALRTAAREVEKLA